ncbi:MAG: hypothetical protein KJ051_01100 [Thermoleophilia bacterium]|nr:hypothetical protein [Thermoleophilia bacterium]
MDYDIPTTRSAELAERLRGLLPGGDTRTGTFYPPYPLALARGAGWRLWDVDGNELIDCVNNFTSLVHGNAAAPIEHTGPRKSRTRPRKQRCGRPESAPLGASCLPIATNARRPPGALSADGRSR